MISICNASSRSHRYVQVVGAANSSAPGVSPRPQLDDLGATAQLVEVVGPPLHHGASLLQVSREVVGSGDVVALHVGELELDVRVLEVVLVQDRRGQAAKPMAGHSVSVAH